MKAITLILMLALLLSACAPSYNQQVISAPIEEIVPVTDETEEQIDPPALEVESGPSDEDVEEEPSEEVEEVEPQNPRLTQRDRERAALGLIDFNTITASNCEIQEEIWDSAIENTNEDLDDKEDELEDELEELERAENRLEEARSKGSSDALIDTYKDQKNDAEDDVDEIEEELEDLEDLLFRTEYTLNEIRDICLGFEQKAQKNTANS